MHSNHMYHSNHGPQKELKTNFMFVETRVHIHVVIIKNTCCT